MDGWTAALLVADVVGVAVDVVLARRVRGTGRDVLTRDHLRPAALARIG
ncbi:hypothetical protein [Dactylosporangium cerinum]